MSLEPVAKLASRPKFDDCKAGSIFSQSDISEGGIGTLREIESSEASADLGPNWSFATGSLHIFLF